jgi:hypothetical protein
MRSVRNYFDGGNREYLSSSDAETVRAYCRYCEYSNGFDDICATSYEEPDPDELAAFWHETEVSL